MTSIDRSRERVASRREVLGSVAGLAAVGGLPVAAAAGAGDARAAASPRPQPDAPPPFREADPRELVAVSFNIRYGTANDGRHAWPNRRELVFGRLRTHDPDVAGLQEALAFQADEIAEALPGYAVLGAGRDDGVLRGELSPILVRTRRFAVLSCRTLWLSDTPERPGSMGWGNTIPRIVVEARLHDRASRRVLCVLNTHWDHRSPESRVKAGDAIRTLSRNAFRRGESVLVTGDFNDVPDGEALARARGEVGDAGPPDARLVDTYAAAHGPGPHASVGTYTAFEDRRDGARIDMILASPDLEVLAAVIDRTRGADGLHPSDHEPVVARLVIPTR